MSHEHNPSKTRNCFRRLNTPPEATVIPSALFVCHSIEPDGYHLHPKVGWQYFVDRGDDILSLFRSRAHMSLYCTVSTHYYKHLDGCKSVPASRMAAERPPSFDPRTSVCELLRMQESVVDLTHVSHSCFDFFEFCCTPCELRLLQSCLPQTLLLRYFIYGPPRLTLLFPSRLWREIAFISNDSIEVLRLGPFRICSIHREAFFLSSVHFSTQFADDCVETINIRTCSMSERSRGRIGGFDCF